MVSNRSRCVSWNCVGWNSYYYELVVVTPKTKEITVDHLPSFRLDVESAQVTDRFLWTTEGAKNLNVQSFKTEKNFTDLILYLFVSGKLMEKI